MSTTGGNGRWLLLAGLMIGGLLTAQAAWACVPQPRLVSVLPLSSGPPGTEVTVDGLGFDPTRAEVRWNARDGQLLASATGPDFSVGVKIPDSTPGLYALVVLSRQPGGAIGNTARAAFQVTDPAGDQGAAAGSPPTTDEAPGRAAAGPAPEPASSSVDRPAAAGLLAAGGVVGGAVVALAQRGRRRRRGGTPG